MFNRPNFGINAYEHTYDSYGGDNNLRREFKDCFKVMLSANYYDYTENGRYYNKFDNEGKSVYYVSQPEIEDKIEEFYSSPTDEDKFLVGFTGIGKTTLIRNCFRITSSNPFVTKDGSLVAYLSVYSDNIESAEDVTELLSSFLKSIIDCITDIYPYDLEDNDNLLTFYDYIKSYKNRLLKRTKIFDSKKKTKKEQLYFLENKKTIEFYSLLLKYLLNLINKDNRIIKQVVMIFDDIESQSVNVHIPFIVKVQNMSACLRSINNRSFIVKSLISLRAYTFRYHNSRQAEARRNYQDTNDVILKDSIPSIKSIFEKRFKVYEENTDLKQVVPNEKRWEESKKVLFSVVNNIANFGDMISAIAHYDISHSLKLFLKVLTNHKWFAPDENYYQGSYSLSAEDYPPIKERVFKALLYGEKDVFVDNDDNVLPNILSIHKEEGDFELVGLYVLEYMKTLQRRNETSIYGFNKKKGKDICDELHQITSIDKNVLTIAVAKLYSQEFLLHSIFEPETIKKDENNNDVFGRKYDENEGLYLSIRGNKVLDMLSNDSLLFEVYRDDIDTELTNNTIISSRLNQEEKLIYLIDYCIELFEVEKSYIMNIDKAQYFNVFNNRFIVSRLVAGITNTVAYYYKHDDSKSILVKSSLAELYSKIINYGNDLLSKNIDLDYSYMSKDVLDLIQ